MMRARAEGGRTGGCFEVRARRAQAPLRLLPLSLGPASTRARPPRLSFAVSSFLLCFFFISFIFSFFFFFSVTHSLIRSIYLAHPPHAFTTAALAVMESTTIFITKSSRARTRRAHRDVCVARSQSGLPCRSPRRACRALYTNEMPLRSSSLFFLRLANLLRGSPAPSSRRRFSISRSLQSPQRLLHFFSPVAVPVSIGAANYTSSTGIRHFPCFRSVIIRIDPHLYLASGIIVGPRRGSSMWLVCSALFDGTLARSHLTPSSESFLHARSEDCPFLELPRLSVVFFIPPGQ